MISAVRSKGGQTDEETAAITFSESFTTFYGTLYIIGHQGLYAPFTPVGVNDTTEVFNSGVS